MYPTSFAKRQPTPATACRSFSFRKRSANAIFAGESADKRSAAAFDINKTARAERRSSKTETLWTQNVVALWEGSDPVLKNEMVAIGAHYDHVGTNPNAPGDDKIWNGADDDGSGTVAVLSIAEALAKCESASETLDPFRLALRAKKKACGAAEYFNKFPTVDIKNVIAQLNIDMIGRSQKAGRHEPEEQRPDRRERDLCDRLGDDELDARRDRRRERTTVI